jgi:hypothetical protein
MAGIGRLKISGRQWAGTCGNGVVDAAHRSFLDALWRLLKGPQPPLHAKLYWFEGADGPAAAMGSANCAAAAWIVAPESGGNIEAVVVYDQPNAEGFESASKLWAAPGQTPAELLTPRPTHDTEPPAHHQPFVLKGLQWDNLSRCLHADIFPAPDLSAIVELLLGGDCRCHAPPNLADIGRAR